MVRIGEDVSERLDVVPAEFFVHRHIRGKWICKCCQHLVQEPVAPQIIDKGMPTAGLIAHTLVAHFVDHLPYYRRWLNASSPTSLSAVKKTSSNARCLPFPRITSPAEVLRAQRHVATSITKLRH
ncbi:IS66 family transposase zinc-finger binding domain-containing protein [Variovorax sp. LT1R20]|uniref:IS66 family transposase zinc-finger binding domain-containing protein n=1 Tax=Variovorax sp. LT1R20 TaxID=3443729 RepID=UPI003F45AC1E